MSSSAPGIDVPFDILRPGSAQGISARLSRQIQWRVFLLSLFVVDSLLLAFAFRVAYFIRFELGLPIFQHDTRPTLAYYQLLTLFLVGVWLAGFALAGLYQRRHLLGGTDEYSHLFRSTTISLLVVVVAGFLGHGLVIARGWLVLAWGLTFVFAATGRFWLRRIAYSMRQHGFFVAPAVIVGANVEGCRLAEQLADVQASGVRIVGFVDEKIPPGSLALPHLTSLGNVEQLGRIIEEHGIEEIILATSAISCRNNLLELFRRYGVSSSVTMRLSSGLYEIMTTGLTVNQLAYVPFVGVNKVRLTGPDQLLKWLLDYGLAIPGLLLAWPIYLLIALAVKLDSPGPVFHRRRVLGVNGKPFDAFKFRTMYVNGDEILAALPDLQAELARTHKLKNDPRITPVGRWLRKLSLDELPQVFNVLRAEMSLVGPRMISPPEMEMYDRWGMNLLTVKPGITGLWQVSGRSDISYDERVRLDMHYVRNWTIWLDLQLLVQTIPAVVRGHGAY
jgi:exopolysaccharide biosynthesis polyprenyl glycosylphosphotransferase